MSALPFHFPAVDQFSIDFPPPVTNFKPHWFFKPKYRINAFTSSNYETNQLVQNLTKNQVWIPGNVVRNKKCIRFTKRP